MNTCSRLVHVNMVNVVVCLICYYRVYVGNVLLCTPSYFFVGLCLFFSSIITIIHVFTLAMHVLKIQVDSYFRMGPPVAPSSCSNGMITLTYVKQPQESFEYLHCLFKNRIWNPCLVYVGKTLPLISINHGNLSWNVCGACCKGLVQQVREFVNLYQPNILFFMETKINFDRTKRVNKRLNFPLFC